MKLILATAALLVSGVVALPQYAAKIPNGYGVPNPGPQGGIWAGVGHVRTAGGGERNSFGLDFAANGFEWTKELCELDSDGDGRSNGEELGDPNCEWSEGQEPAGPALSHPGIVDEPKEAGASSQCDNYVAPDDEMTMDISFTVPVNITKKRTHYQCEQMLLDVPAKTVLHKIKHGVLLDNHNILHHMFVYICPAGTDSSDGNKVGEGPYKCSGNESGCRRIGGWAVGPHESCNPPNVGHEMDFSELDQFVVKIEAHYDNNMGTSQLDQSGLRLYMTPTLRPLTGSQLWAGMMPNDIDFLIPPNETNYPLSNICPTVMTERMDRPVYVYGFNPHMHLYGHSLVTEHYRCGQKIGEIGRISDYEFDNQQTYTLDPPVKILPGDALVTTCQFNTTMADSDIKGGRSTNREMCFNFLDYYPIAGTEKIPTLMSACISVETGFRRKGGMTPIRGAFGDLDQKSLVFDFESKPEASVGSCCESNNCEELYVSGADGACGVDTDCINDLVCVGGICEFPPHGASTQALESSARKMNVGLFLCWAGIAAAMSCATLLY
ncbi:Tyramine beta-hydroxylase [Seminavis robusta]|uniref:Tyramine beta-hydroxylase n=1 Tax=Seminavis robusta TaxID=568900 RepID=A0A9N8H7U9_9STRA|nr:Tyramine beta-hydroxylase [Seminavis robusta]|eukprot:Sro76_g041530.1 Tyramine beta-hydroxylase (551) ;mRNA; r:24608-26260